MSFLKLYINIHFAEDNFSVFYEQFKEIAILSCKQKNLFLLFIYSVLQGLPEDCLGLVCTAIVECIQTHLKDVTTLSELRICVNNISSLMENFPVGMEIRCLSYFMFQT